jgi:hypothetical protein
METNMNKKKDRDALTAILVNMHGREAFDDVKINDGLYNSYFLEAVLDGSIKQNINWKNEADKQMMEDFDKDFLDFEAITTHYKNLMKGKELYELKQQAKII